MDNEKNMGMEEEAPASEGSGDSSAPRARNRTVMLTPEITGQVRARLAQETPEPQAHGGAEPPGVGGGFVPVSPRRGGGSEQQESRGRQSHGGGGGGGFAAPAHYRQSAPAAGEAFTKDTVVWSKPGPLVGFLVSFDADPNGDFFVLRSGRMIVTSEAPSAGNFLFIKDESVSPMHAIVRVSEEGEIQVLDQLSECGSGVKRYQSGEDLQLSGEKCSLTHGDIIRFGKRSFHVCMMPKKAE